MGGVEKQSAKKSASTGKYGKDTSLDEAMGAGDFEGSKASAVDERTAHMKNRDGKAKTLGHNAVDKMDQQAQGMMDAKMYDKDGSNGETHQKFMEGGKELTRKAVVEKEFAMHDSLHGKSKKQKDDIFDNLEAAAGGKVAMDMSKAKGTVRNLNVSHDGNGNVISVNADKTISATTIDPKTLKAEKISTTLSKASEMIGDAEMNQMAGKGAAIDKATDGGKNMNKMFRNAAASELSTFEQLNAAIEAQGGVVPLSKLKGSASYMQTAALSETTDAKLKEGLIQHAKDNGMNISSDQANKMLQKLKEGGDYLTKSIKDAFNSVAKLEGAQQGAKTKSDFRSFDTLGGGDANTYAENMAAMAGKKAEEQKRTLKADKDLGLMNSDGTLSEDGKNVIDLNSFRQEASLAATPDALKAKETWVKGLWKKEYDEQIKAGKSSAEANAAANKKIENYLDDKGHVLSGKGLIAREEALKKRMFAGHEQIQINNTTAYSGGIGFNGKGGVGSFITGQDTKINATTPENINIKKTAREMGLTEGYVKEQKNKIEAQGKVLDKAMLYAIGKTAPKSAIVNSDKHKQYMEQGKTPEDSEATGFLGEMAEVGKSILSFGGAAGSLHYAESWFKSGAKTAQELGYTLSKGQWLDDAGKVVKTDAKGFVLDSKTGARKVFTFADTITKRAVQGSWKVLKTSSNFVMQNGGKYVRKAYNAVPGGPKTKAVGVISVLTATALSKIYGADLPDPAKKVEDEGEGSATQSGSSSLVSNPSPFLSPSLNKPLNSTSNKSGSDKKRDSVDSIDEHLKNKSKNHNKPPKVLNSDSEVNNSLNHIPNYNTQNKGGQGAENSQNTDNVVNTKSAQNQDTKGQNTKKEKSTFDSVADFAVDVGSALKTPLILQTSDLQALEPISSKEYQRMSKMSDNQLKDLVANGSNLQEQENARFMLNQRAGNTPSQKSSADITSSDVDFAKISEQEKIKEQERQKTFSSTSPSAQPATDLFSVIGGLFNSHDNTLQTNNGFAGIRATNTVPTTQGAVQTVAAAQADPGLPQAIDTYNTQQNIQTIQNGLGNSFAMQTRGGAMRFAQGSNGGTNITMPGALSSTAIFYLVHFLFLSLYHL